MSLPPITALPTLPHDALTAALDLLFEPTRHLHDLVLPLLSSPFPSYPALIATIRDRLHVLVREANHDDPEKKHALHGILGSHPRLGEPREGVLSEQSKLEQRNLKAGGDEAEAEGRELARLNREYEEAFPGLRYVVFVNGRGRGEVMADMRGRIEKGRGRLAGEGEGKEGTMEGEEERGVDVSLFLCGSVSDLGRGANVMGYRPCAILRWIGRERYWPRMLLEEIYKIQRQLRLDVITAWTASV